MPPTRDLANSGMCPDWELNQQPFGSQAGTQSTEPHQPGLTLSLNIYSSFRWPHVSKKSDPNYTKDSNRSNQFLACFSSCYCSRYKHVTNKTEEKGPFQLGERCTLPFPLAMNEEAYHPVAMRKANLADSETKVPKAWRKWVPMTQLSKSNSLKPILSLDFLLSQTIDFLLV